jgi:xylulokinase
VAGKDAHAAARAVVEAQALSMRLHAAFIGHVPERILVTGGASANAGILRVLADVFQADIVPLAVSNSSALGGALRAAQAVEGRDWQDLFARFAAPHLDRRVKANPTTKVVYEDLGAQLGECIDDVVAETAPKR